MLLCHLHVRTCSVVIIMSVLLFAHSAKTVHVPTTLFLSHRHRGLACFGSHNGLNPCGLRFDCLYLPLNYDLIRRYLLMLFLLHFTFALHL